MRRYRWRDPDPVPASLRLTDDHPFLDAILYRRGIRDRRDADRFLAPRLEHLPDPMSLPELGRAVSLIEQARRAQRPVVIFGDYDVDGLTATSLLTFLFRHLGLEAIPMVPHRLLDGYGFHPRFVPVVVERNPSLLVTVDCGTGDWEALEAVRAAGIPVVVLDHHDVHRLDWPPSVVFVSVKRPDVPEAFRSLAAVGVAYQLARVLLGEEGAARYLPLVALGTVADVVPLRGPNRVLVAVGLERFWEAAPLGLRTLATAAGLAVDRTQRITSWHCGYILGPRLNAAGRMDDPRLALELLLTDDPERARTLARLLCTLNAARQRAIERIVHEAERRLQGRRDLPPVLVLADQAWQVGLVGLAASKLVGRYARPAVVLARGEAVSRGSARSVDGFDISAALERCGDLLLDHGGHSAAAGLTVATERIAELEERLAEVAREFFGPHGPALPLDLDLELHPYQVSPDTWDILARLEPFGNGNPVPRCLLRHVRAVDVWRTQDGRHLRFTVVARDGTVRQAIWFDGGREYEWLVRTRQIDVAFTLRRSTWTGQDRVELDVIDVRPTV